MRYPKMSEAAKKRVSSQGRASGKFTAKEKTLGVEQRHSDPLMPPSGNVNYSSLFVGLPNPVQGLFYNPDEAFLSNPENASRMIQDMAIYSALQERQLATAALPWSITPQDENDPEQKAAADLIEDIIRGRLPNLPDFFRNLLDSIWFGRSGCYIDYEWDFSDGRRLMVPKQWTPVHGDTIVFGPNGEIGYKVGPATMRQDVIVGVPGRAIMVKQEPVTSEDGNAYLQPEERKAWVVHHHQKTAGEYQIFTSAAAIYGLGLRSRVYPVWLLKQSAMQFLMQAAEKFGAGWVIGYFDGGNQKSADAVRAALQKQVGSCVQMFPRFAPEQESIEGMEVINPPSGFESLLEIIRYYDKQLRMTICSESLTSDNEHGTGLGSNAAEVQQTTFGRLIKYDSAALGETITDQVVSVLQEFNGLDHLPPLRFEFSFDLGTTKEKLENAKMLYDMGIKVSSTELIKACGFTVPKASELIDENGSIATDNMEATNEINTEGAVEENSGNTLETVND